MTDVRILALRRLVSLALVAALLVVLAPAKQAEAVTPNQIRNQLERKVNKARERRDLRLLKRAPENAKSQIIEDGAQDWAWHIANVKYEHDDMTALRISLNADWVGENIGVASNSEDVAERLHRAFMGSDLHRANILKKRATHMGIGVVKKGGKTWVVERFADLW